MQSFRCFSKAGLLLKQLVVKNVVGFLISVG